MRRDATLAVLLGLALLAVSCGRRSAGPASTHSPLFTGKEAKRKVLITLPGRQQAGFVTVEREIYATGSNVAQGKQLLLALMAGPTDKETQATACFGPAADYSELYLDGKGLAVLDLPSATVKALPGGTSAEVATAYCIIRTLSQDLPQVSRVQFLIDGQPAQSLRGHLDLLDPLALNDL